MPTGEVTKTEGTLSNLVPALLYGLESQINSANSSLVVQMKISEASEKKN